MVKSRFRSFYKSLKEVARRDRAKWHSFSKTSVVEKYLEVMEINQTYALTWSWPILGSNAWWKLFLEEWGRIGRRKILLKTRLSSKTWKQASQERSREKKSRKKRIIECEYWIWHYISQGVPEWSKSIYIMWYFKPNMRFLDFVHLNVCHNTNQSFIEVNPPCFS